MNKQAILQDLTKLANQCDEQGKYEAAEAIDKIIKTYAQQTQQSDPHATARKVQEQIGLYQQKIKELQTQLKALQLAPKTTPAKTQALSPQDANLKKLVEEAQRKTQKSKGESVGVGELGYTMPGRH